MNRDRVRRYVELRDDPSVPQVLGRFCLPPSAEDEARELLESPDSAGEGRGGPRKNLYRHVVTPPSEGGEGYPSPPSGVGVRTPYSRESRVGGVE